MKRTNLGPRKKRGPERGSVLITAIMVIMVMLIMAIPFLVKLSAENRSTERAARALAALNLAEAGVDKVVWRLNRDISDGVYDPNTDPERIVWNEDGTAGIISNIKTPDNLVRGDVAVMLSPDPDPTGTAPAVTRVLESTGAVPFIADRTVDRTVRVVLEKYFGSIFDYGFVIDEYFNITNTQLTVDSYDSRVANYDPQNPGDFGNMAILDAGAGSFTVDQGGGGTVNVTGALYAGADALTDGDPNTNPTEALADSIIDLPKQIDSDVTQLPMESPFILPEVDLKTLHPKETWPSNQDISSWFTNDYLDGTQLPSWDQVNDTFKGGTGATGKTLNVSGSATLSESDNGVYRSFVLADAANLTVGANQNVVIMVSELPQTPLSPLPEAGGQFTMGRAANIVLEEGATLTLILGRTSFYMGHQATINVPLIGTVDEPGTPADCMILGMTAFAPDQPKVDTDLSKKEGFAIQKDPSLSPIGTVMFEQQVDIAAAIYTPLAQSFDIMGMNHADIYGAWLANSMVFKVAAGFHYDLALGDITTIKGGPPKWKILNWQEKIGN
jgi:hypothetical protein